MSSASKPKPKPPERPPPPRGLSFGGMSFKSLEEEEDDEDDLTITDKYSSHLHRPAHANPVSESSTLENTELHKTGKAAEKDMGMVASHKTGKAAEKDMGMVASFIQKRSNKSVQEYKELFSGLKGKIQEKIQERITKTMEDFSSDSASAGLEDKKKPAPSSTTTEASKETPTKTTAKLQKSSTDPQIRPSLLSTSLARTRSEEKQDSLVKELQPVELSLVRDDVSGEDSIVVKDSSPPQKAHDITDIETILRCRSKATKKKESPQLGADDTRYGCPTSGSKKDNLQVNIDKNKNMLHSKKSLTSAQACKSPSSQKTGLVCQLMNLGGRLSLRQQLLVVVFCILGPCILPIPSFLSGMILGCVMTASCLALYTYIMRPPKHKDIPALVPLEDLPPMEIPEMKEASLLDGIYEGWLNEAPSYNPEEYHISQTSSVFITLEGTKLCLQKPKTSVPKRAMHDEDIPTPQFVEQRQFELKGSRVSLLPPNLVKKRVWSKKYPICIALAQPGTCTKLTGYTLTELSSRDSSDDPSTSQESPNQESPNQEKKCGASVLFLFTRTGREKEEWFHRFHAASEDRPLANAILEMRRAIERYRQSQQRRRTSSEGLPLQRRNSAESMSSIASDPAESPAATEMEVLDPMLEFTRYMGHLMPTATFSHLLSPKTSRDSAAMQRLPFSGSIICDSQLYWLNALIGRCFFDFLRDSWWADKVKDKLQRKLTKIHIPYFIEELQVTAIHLGKEMPVVRRAANPYLDEQGFWVELDLSYSGGFKMTIETKVNLMKLKRNNPNLSQASEAKMSDRSPVTDPDEEDSAESSTDDEEEAACPEDKESGGSKRLMKYLDKLTSWRYFQQATEYKYIKRAMENVSNTPLQLQVSVNSLVGKLAVNIPPPPSDRLWYGFRGPPRLSLVAKPQVGERVVTITHITDWIERKLELEFQRVFVMPNMDDLVIPILRPSEEEEQTYHLSTPPPSDDAFCSLAVD